MRSKLSVLGIYNYDGQIFDRLELPEGVDKDTVVNSILLECADLEVLYPVPVVLQTAIGLWSKSMLPSWERQYRAITAEYDPIENYNRFEDWTDTAHSEGAGSSEVAGFDSGKMTPRDGSQSAADSNSDHHGRIHGNIGVTTSTAMVQEEVNLRRKLSMVDIIVNDFKSRFTLLVY